MRKVQKIGVIALFGALILPASLAAATFTVTKTADTNDGSCDADCSLREAVVAANAAGGADQITLPAGTFTLTIAPDGTPDDGEDGDLDISGETTIQGAGASATIIDGGGLEGVFELNLATSVAAMSGVTVQGGGGPGLFIDGAGIRVGNGASLTLEDCVITNNEGDGGGALRNSDGTLHITRCVVSDNDGFDGGALYNDDGTVTIVDSTFSGNSVGDGGGGGAIDNRGTGNLTITSSTFSGNQANGNGGGAVSNNSPTGVLVMTNVTVSGNSDLRADGYGGGLYNNGTATLTNVTFSGNSAPQGSNIQNSNALTLRNTIVADGLSDDNCDGTITDGGGNLQFPGASCGTGITVADPLLGELQDNGGLTRTHALSAGSPAIDVADDTACIGELAIDQRGAVRVDQPDVGTSVCDVGAYELGGCGNNLPEAGEACDDGNDIETDACLSTCAAASCGDGFVQEDVEDCDGLEGCSDECALTDESGDSGSRPGGGGCSLVPAVETGPNDVRISSMGPDGDIAYSGYTSAAAYNDRSREFFVVWIGDDDAGALVAGEREIFGQRIDAASGALVGDRVRLSDIGADGDTARGVFFSVDVAYNPEADEYMVVWDADDDAGGVVDNKYEVYGQRVDAAGAEVGANDFRISTTGLDNDSGHVAVEPSVAYNAANNEFFVVWRGNTPALPPGVITEIYGQRIDADDGALLGSDAPIRVADAGSEQVGNAVVTQEPEVAYNATDNQYLVVFRGDVFKDDEIDIFAQRVDAASGAPLGVEFRVSDMGDGVAHEVFAGFEPHVAYNSRQNEYLVVWEGDDGINNEFEVYGQRLDGATGVAVGTDDFRISHLGPDGSNGFNPLSLAVAYNAVNGEYLAVWTGDHDQDGQINDEHEVLSQRIEGVDGSLLGAMVRLSDLQGLGHTGGMAQFVNIAFGLADNAFLVTWDGDDDVPPLVSGEREVFGQLLSAAGCGNGVLEGVEACDDGNAAEGDGCSAACTIESAEGSADDPANEDAGVGSGDSSGDPASGDGEGTGAGNGGCNLVRAF